MNRTFRGSFLGTRWDETPFHELAQAGKLSRASIVNAYHGDFEAAGTLEYLLAYPVAEGPVYFTGMERIVLAGATTDSLVLRHEGIYSMSEGVKGTLTVVPGSGIGCFTGVSGEGWISARAGEHGGAYELVVGLPG